MVIATTLAFGGRVALGGVALSTFPSVSFFEPVGTLAIHHAVDLVKVEVYAVLATGCVLGLARLGDAMIAADDKAEALERSDKEQINSASRIGA